MGDYIFYFLLGLSILLILSSIIKSFFAFTFILMLKNPKSKKDELDSEIAKDFNKSIFETIKYDFVTMGVILLIQFFSSNISNANTLIYFFVAYIVLDLFYLLLVQIISNLKNKVLEQ